MTEVVRSTTIRDEPPNIQRCSFSFVLPSFGQVTDSQHTAAYWTVLGPHATKTTAIRRLVGRVINTCHDTAQSLPRPAEGHDNSASSCAGRRCSVHTPAPSSRSRLFKSHTAPAIDKPSRHKQPQQVDADDASLTLRSESHRQPAASTIYLAHTPNSNHCFSRMRNSRMERAGAAVESSSLAWNDF